MLLLLLFLRLGGRRRLGFSGAGLDLRCVDLRRVQVHAVGGGVVISVGARHRVQKLQRRALETPATTTTTRHKEHLLLLLPSSSRLAAQGRFGPSPHCVLASAAPSGTHTHTRYTLLLKRVMSFTLHNTRGVRYVSSMIIVYYWCEL